MLLGMSSFLPNSNLIGCEKIWSGDNETFSITLQYITLNKNKESWVKIIPFSINKVLGNWQPVQQWQYCIHCWRSERFLSKKEKVCRKLSLTELSTHTHFSLGLITFSGMCVSHFKASLSSLLWNCQVKLNPWYLLRQLYPAYLHDIRCTLTIMHRGTYFFPTFMSCS